MKTILVCDELINNMRSLALVYPISVDLLDIDGFSGMFHQRHPRVVAALRKKNDISVGKIYRFKHRNPTFVSYSLVVKKDGFERVSPDSYERSLKELKRVLLAENIGMFDIPLLGAGIDRVDWLTMSNILNRVFSDFKGVCYVHIHPTQRYLVERCTPNAEIYN